MLSAIRVKGGGTRVMPCIPSELGRESPGENRKFCNRLAKYRKTSIFARFSQMQARLPKK